MATYGYRQQRYGAPRPPKAPRTNLQAPYQSGSYGQDYRPTPPPATPRAWGPGGPGWQAQQGLKPPVAPVQAPTVAPPSGGGQQQAAPAPSGYDWSTDPILQKVQALGVTARGNARGEATKLKSQAAIQYGDESIARQLTGDEGTALSAKGNPFSVVNMLKRDYEDENRMEDQGFNQRNLFYSGARGEELGRNAQGYQQRTAESLGGLQGLFGDIDSNLAAALMGADQEDAAAQESAYMRALNHALTSGIDPGAGSVDPFVAALTGGVKTREETRGGFGGGVQGGLTADAEARKRRMMLEGLLW